MNEHPPLADYVDGSLDRQDRARVEAHVRDCPACREEVELASAAREALAGLPDVEPPPGLTFEVRRRARRPRGALAWKVATGAAAAAVLAAGIVVAIGPPGGPLGGQPQGAEMDAGGGARGQETAVPEAAGPQKDAEATARTAAPVEPIYRQTDRDYDTGTILTLGRRLRDQVRASLRSGFRQPATAFYGDFELDRFPDEARRAVECLLREAPPDELVVPYLVERASFQGEPAFVGAFLQGPSNDEPYDRILLWVVAREDCTLRSFATIRF
ncbi:MAG TPA: zf-HC2 domain-containing protein [Actinomycetota bacterium]|nr:zf-HC2 domain-containing protein [Actinomycetota bacterium]